MFKLIEAIKENSKIRVRGKDYNVLAKVLYVTESENGMPKFSWKITLF